MNSILQTENGPIELDEDVSNYIISLHKENKRLTHDINELKLKAFESDYMNSAKRKIKTFFIRQKPEKIRISELKMKNPLPPPDKVSEGVRNTISYPMMKDSPLPSEKKTQERCTEIFVLQTIAGMTLTEINTLTDQERKKLCEMYVDRQKKSLKETKPPKFPNDRINDH